MKKILSVGMGAVLALSACSLAACGGGETIVQDGKTLNMRIYAAGYGDAHYKALNAMFERTYAEEGYKVNIVSSTSALSMSDVQNELLLGDKNGIDLYFVANGTSDSFANMSKQEKRAVAADLTDVMNSYAVNAKKEEETEWGSIKDRLKEGYYDVILSHSSGGEYGNKVYYYPIVSSPMSLLANMKVLDAYNMDIPLTTNQLLKCFEVISENPNPTSTITNVKPTSWAGYNAHNYWFSVEDVWVAQYESIKYYNNFLNMEGYENIEDAAELYESDAWLHSLTVMETMLDKDNAPNGVMNMAHGNAQHIFLTNGAAFMANGAWLQNEMAENYKDKMNDIVMFHAPLISALGEKLRLDGSMSGAVDAELCDNVLAECAKLLDEGKTNEEIISAVTTKYSVDLTDEKVETVRQARGVYFDLGQAEGAVVNAESDKVDIAKLYLRFLASNDGASCFYNFASAYTPYITDINYDDYSVESELLRSVRKIVAPSYSNYIFRGPGGNRTSTQLQLFPGYIDHELLMANGAKASEIMSNSRDYVRKNWTNLCKENSLS